MLQANEAVTGPPAQQDNDTQLQLNASGNLVIDHRQAAGSEDLDETPCQDERNTTRSSTPDKGKASQPAAPQFSPIRTESGGSGYETAEEAAGTPDQLTTDQLKAVERADEMPMRQKKTSDKHNKSHRVVRSCDFDLSRMSKSQKNKLQKDLRRDSRLQKSSKGKVIKPTNHHNSKHNAAPVQRRTPVKRRLDLSYQVKNQKDFTPAPPKVLAESIPNSQNAPTEKGSDPPSNNKQVATPPKKPHPGVKAVNDSQFQLAKLKGIIKNKEALLRKKDEVIDSLGRKNIARSSLLLADCKPGKVIERLHAADTQIKRRPFCTPGQWIDQHNAACNLLLAGRSAEWMGTCGSSALPENFFCPEDSMSTALTFVLERIPKNYRNILVAASSLLSLHYLSNLDLVAPPPLPILKLKNTDEKVTRPSLGTAQKKLPTE